MLNNLKNHREKTSVHVNVRISKIMPALIKVGVCTYASFGPLLLRGQPPSSNINHCVLTICNLKFVIVVECLVRFESEPRPFQFDHNALIHLATLPK